MISNSAKWREELIKVGRVKNFGYRISVLFPNEPSYGINWT